MESPLHPYCIIKKKQFTKLKNIFLKIKYLFAYNVQLKISIINYRCGNLFNLANAVKEIGFMPTVASKPQELNNSDVVILGGVGAFHFGIKSIISFGFQKKLKEMINSRTKIIGICLGAQLMLEEGEEFIKTKGLNLIRGKCKSMNNISEKIPATGWYQVKFSQQSAFKDLNNQHFYFNHSFRMSVQDKYAIQSTYKYYQANICAGFEKKNLLGFQFHPEKSGPNGLKLLKKAVLL